MNDADQIANMAFSIMQQLYPTEFQRCVAEARAQIAEEALKNLREEQGQDAAPEAKAQ